jgi:hypothetical protein
MMRRTQRWTDREDEEASADRQTKSLAGLAVSLFLVVVSLGLIQVLHKKSCMEDCLLSGRTNCGRGWSWPMTQERQDGL